MDQAFTQHCRLMVNVVHERPIERNPGSRDASLFFHEYDPEVRGVGLEDNKQLHPRLRALGM